MTLLPLSPPELSPTILSAVFKTVKVTDPVRLLGVRGFFASLANRRAEFDDAVFLQTPSGVFGFNANTDPTGYRPGHGTEEKTKGLATLMEGVWLFRLGMHQSKYLALVQAASVTVLRDADEIEDRKKVRMKDGYACYEDTGNFGIHIHSSGWANTGSLGCQTIYAAQWDEFIRAVQSAMEAENQKVIPYILIENTGVLA